MSFYKSKEFKDLDAKWKSKLKKSGFKDIEFQVQESDRYSYCMLPGLTSKNIAKQETSRKRQLVDLWAAWYWHAPNKKRLEKFLAVRLKDGKTYRQIIKDLGRTKFLKNFKGRNVWTLELVHIIIRDLYDSKVVPWNYEHPMGASYVDQDQYLEEVMIREPESIGSKNN